MTEELSPGDHDLCSKAEAIDQESESMKKIQDLLTLRLEESWPLESKEEDESGTEQVCADLARNIQGRVVDGHAVEKWSSRASPRRFTSRVDI
jgi:hypothetical protein